MNADKPVEITRLANALSTYYLEARLERGVDKRPRKLRDTLHRDIEALLAAGVVISRNGEEITYHSPPHLNVNLDDAARGLLANLASCLPAQSLSPLLSFALAHENLRFNAPGATGDDGDGGDASAKRGVPGSDLYARGKVRLGIPPGAHTFAMVSAVAHRILCVVTYQGHRYYLVPLKLMRAYKALYVQAWALPLGARQAPAPADLPPVDDEAWMVRTFRIDRIDAVRMVELFSSSLPEAGEPFAFSTDVTLAYHPGLRTANTVPPLLLRAEPSPQGAGEAGTYHLKNIETNFLLEELAAYKGELTLTAPTPLKRQLQENIAWLARVAAQSAELEPELSQELTPYERRALQASTIPPFYKALELIGYVSAHGATDLGSLGAWAGLKWNKAASMLIDAALIDDAEHFIPFELHLPSLILGELSAKSEVSISFPHDVSLPVRVEEVVLLVNVIDAALEVEGRALLRRRLTELRAGLTTALHEAHMDALVWPAPSPQAGVQVLDGVAHALEDGREITFSYLRVRDEGEADSSEPERMPAYSHERMVPGMIEVGARSYLLGLKDGTFRRYRLDRITNLHVESQRRTLARKAYSRSRKQAHAGLATYPQFHVEGEEVHLLLTPRGRWLLDTLTDVSLADDGTSTRLAHLLPDTCIASEDRPRAQLVVLEARSLAWLASVLIQAGHGVAYIGPGHVAEHVQAFLASALLIEGSE